MRSPLQCALMLCLLWCSLSSFAAPTTTLGEGEAEVAPVVDPGTKAPPKGVAVDAATMRDVPNSSNTIQMLLELQAVPEQGASAAGSGRATPRTTGSRPPGQTAAANPFGNGDNPFNASPGIAKPSDGASGARAGVEWSAAANSAGFTGGFGGAPTITTTAQDPHQFAPPRRNGYSSADVEPRWWMPSAWIRWVREHRQEVLIGAAVALALAWAGASRSSARRP